MREHGVQERQCCNPVKRSERLHAQAAASIVSSSQHTNDSGDRGCVDVGCALQDKTASQCGAIQGTTIFNVTVATAPWMPWRAHLLACLGAPSTPA